MDELEQMLNELDIAGVTNIDKNVINSSKLEKESKPSEPIKDIEDEMKNLDYSQEFIEVMDITKSYIRNAFEIELQMKELKQELKEIKIAAKEEGVRVRDAAKAIKELIKELKETSDEAKHVEDLKRFIKGDESLYSHIVIAANE